MNHAKYSGILLAIILLIMLLGTMAGSAIQADPIPTSGKRADDNASAYIYLESADNEQEITPDSSVTYRIIIRNLGDENITYYPPDPNTLNLPAEWVIGFYPGSGIYIPGNNYGTLDVSLSAPTDAKANTVVELEISGTTSIPDATIIPVELRTTVRQLYGITLTTVAKITLASPTEPENLELSIKNTGNGDDRIAVELLDVPTGLTLSQEAQEFIIGPGDTEYFTITLFPSSILTAGEYKLNISLYRVFETSLSRVWVSSHILTIEVVYYPDLFVSTGDIELSIYGPQTGDDVTINVTIHNIGDSDARNVTVRIYPVTRSGSKLSDIDDVVIDFLGLDNTTILHIPWCAEPPAVNKLMVLVDPGNTVGELNEENNEAELNLFIIPPPTKGPSSSEPQTGEFSFVQITAVGIIMLLSGIGAATYLTTEYGKFAMFKFLAPFYTRVKKEEVLNHEVRELVYDYVKTHPGEHFRAILTQLGLKNGTLVHHLHTLERQDFIKSERDGPFKRFYPAGRQLTEDVLEINGIQRKILDAVKVSPGLTQKDLAILLHTSPPTINYHVKALLSVQLLNLKREGKNTRCFPGHSLNGWYQRSRVS